MPNSGNFCGTSVTHFTDRLQFAKSFPANSIILKPASLHCSLSMIVLASTIAGLSEATRRYRKCPYRSRAQIEAGARIEAGGQEDKSLIEAGSRIVAGSRTGVRRESIANRDRYASRSYGKPSVTKFGSDYDCIPKRRVTV